MSILKERASFIEIEAREYEGRNRRNHSLSQVSKKKQMIDLTQHLERYINTLSVFRFNSGRYDLHFIKSYLIPYLINKKEIEHSVMKKANDFVSIKFGDVQLLDLMKFFSGATILDSFFS